MRNTELSILNDWRFCNVKHLDKIPYPNNWQNTPLTLEQVSSTNVGVILGSHSNGLCAIDFDGIEAIDHWSNTFDIDIIDLNTVMWTSGKEYRCQIAFTIPNEYWDILKRKVVNKLEFRWNCQSVLPPSKLNDGREYIWLKSPINHTVQQLPDQVLAYWLKLIYDDITRYDVEYVQKSYSKNFDEELINELLSRISRKVGNLRGDYDVWRTIAWATCHSVGINTAQMLMLYYWPEKTKKEMHTLKAWKHTHRGPTIGTLIKLAGLSKLEHKLLEIQYKKRKLQ